MTTAHPPYAARAREIAVEVAEAARTARKKSVFSIENTSGMKGGEAFFPPIRHAPGAVAGTVKIFTVVQARGIARAVDGMVDIILLDVERKAGELKGLEAEVGKEVVKSRLLTAKPNDMTVDAADALISG